MRKLLNQKVAEAARITPKPYQIHDTAIPGLILRVSPSGSKIWKLIQNRKPRTLGKMPVWTFAMAKAEAERILRGEEEQPEATPLMLTLGEFLEQHYRPWVRANHARPDDTLARVNNIGLNDKLMDEIQLMEVEGWRVKRQLAGINPTTINRDTVALKAALQKAVKWKLLKQHPLAELEPLRVDRNPTPRFLKASEEKALYAALEARDEKKRLQRESANKWRIQRHQEPLPELGTYCDNLTPLVKLAINTGLRRGELWNLRWADVDLKRKSLTVHGKGAKSKQTRHIPLNADALAVLKLHRGSVVPMPTVPVFGHTTFRKSFAQVLKDAKIKNFRFHDLRHTFASKLVMAGIPLNTVRELLGHKKLEMTLRYAHLAPDNLRDAVDAISSTGGAS